MIFDISYRISCIYICKIFVVRAGVRGTVLGSWIQGILALLVVSNLNIFVVHAGVWDVVVTCFFIDTAHNIVEYIEIISRILKDGGVSSSICMSKDFFAFLIALMP